MTDHSANQDQFPLTKTISKPFRFSAHPKLVQTLVLCFVWTVTLALTTQAQKLTNDTLVLQLNVSSEGIPVIEEGRWLATGARAFRDLGTPDGLAAWVPPALIPEGQIGAVSWTITKTEALTIAEATRELRNKLRITWIIELPNQGQLFRLHVRLTNGGKKPKAIDSFPAWSARWDVGGQTQQVRWWKSLEYNRVEQSLDPGSRIRLGSRLHSSDDADGGVNPYWVVGNSSSRIYFGVEWCGGWGARLDGLDSGFSFSASLPSEETQLVLKKGETIDGPALLITPMPNADDTDNRAAWMRQRRALARSLFTGPAPSYPLLYNHWYAARRQVDEAFLNRQINAMSPYKFDAFIIDAGWFDDGKWRPDPQKFGPGGLIEILTTLKTNGVKPGLWSTPQYVSDVSSAELIAEEPAVSSRFFDGLLVDMSEQGFTEYLTAHVSKLRRKFLIDYWKYDQAFFTDRSRAGEMKNVVGFQNALRAVRQANPDLTIENCQLGGRMINEFTLMATQTTWLRDAGNRGLEDPRVNIRTALGALEFVFPWAALRFTINLDQMDQNDDEMTRLYCRSAMAGTWGISADLSEISERQRSIVLAEIQNYRRLNRSKFSSIYDLVLPDDRADVAGVTFYSGRRSRAGVLLYRWQATGAFEHKLVLPKLNPSTMYRVVDADTGTELIASGSDLMSTGVIVSFSGERLSAMLFVDMIPESPAQ